MDFNNFIDHQIVSQATSNHKEEARKENLRLFQTTKGDNHVAQPEVINLGHRHMFTTNQIEIPANRPDKLFMASHKMNKFSRAITNKEVEEYIDKNIPYTKDKEITFWSANLNKGNMYNSHSLGINPFGRSNAFTQGIQHTKGASQFVGNNHSSSTSKHIFLNEHDDKYYNELQQNLTKKNEAIDLIPQITNKVMKFCQSKGWLGMRKMKIFLRNLNKRKSDLIDKTELKYNFHHYGLTLQDDELNYIYLKYDRLKCNKINFIEFFDSLHSMSPQRRNIINCFINEVNPSDEKFISLKKLIRIANFNYHPEVVRYAVTSNQAVKDYGQSWDNLREDDFITKDNFVKFFEDVSYSIESDEGFSQCMMSLGKKQ